MLYLFSVSSKYHVDFVIEQGTCLVIYTTVLSHIGPKVVLLQFLLAKLDQKRTSKDFSLHLHKKALVLKKHVHASVVPTLGAWYATILAEI